MTRRLTALSLALCAAGCAVNTYPTVSEFAHDTGANSFEVFNRSLSSPQALVLPVVHDQQTRVSACGAHTLASVMNYWRGTDTLDGDNIFQLAPPASAAGYSMAELVAIARDHGFLASAVRLPNASVVQELERGRPVLAPVRVPAIYIQQRTLPGANAPVVGIARNTLVNRAGRVAEMSNVGMVDHYVLIVGYEGDTFVIVEPIMGYRTISRSSLERYRAHFGNAAIVMSDAQTRRSSSAPPFREG